VDPDVTPEPAKKTAPLKNLLAPLKNLAGAIRPPPIPKKLVIPAVACVVLLIAGGTAFGLLHTRQKHSGSPHGKTVASAQVASGAGVSGAGPSGAGAAGVGPSAVGAAGAGPSAACSGVVRDIYRQTVAEDPSVTLAEVRSEVGRSGVTCEPAPEIVAQIRDLSPACRDIVQYTFLGVRNGNPDITVSDVRARVVEKSVACEHDRSANVASIARHKEK
jgi:hypothetical protein